MIRMFNDAYGFRVQSLVLFPKKNVGIMHKHKLY